MFRSSTLVTAPEVARARDSAIMSFTVGLLAVIAALLVLFIVGARPVQAATTFTVNSTGDAGDATTADDTCDSDAVTTGEQCTLRAAIQQANVTSGADTIEFNIPGTGVRQIQLLDPLPEITEGVSINGYTQPGALANTVTDARSGTNAQIKIELDGSCANCGTGFNIMADNVVIKGLAIYGFNASAIFSVFEPDGLRIEGNFIGTDSGGTADKGNGGGIVIQAKDQSTVGTANVTVGGDMPEARNLISGNDGSAIDVADLRDSKVQGNLIGTQKDGTTALPNQGRGVSLARVFAFNAVNNSVGGTTVGSANVIAHNVSEGVSVCGLNNVYTQASIRRNSIFDNFKGIELCLTFPEDPGDTDEGSNGGQNYPVITSAKTSRKATTIKGTFDSEAAQGYTLEFFSNPPESPDEGKTFKAERSITTDNTADPDSFTFKLKGAEKIPAKQFVTATATNGDGDTSEFSLPVRVKRQ